MRSEVGKDETESALIAQETMTEIGFSQGLAQFRDKYRAGDLIGRGDRQPFNAGRPASLIECVDEM
jgi:hypothetical protein